jgi:hypothetical protein
MFLDQRPFERWHRRKAPQMSSSMTDVPRDAGVLLAPRGYLSEIVLANVRELESPRSPASASLMSAARQATLQSADVVSDDDIQFTLFLLYSLAYRSLHHANGASEWHPELVKVRLHLEAAFESTMRASTPMPEIPPATASAVAASLLDMTSPNPGPSVVRYLAHRATTDEFLEFMMHRSIYQLREADPHSWAIPRLTGRPKAALVEIQADEYGGGRPERVHAELFAQAMRGAGLSDQYGAYANDVPALTLASHNLMSMFGLNGRLLGAIVGHLAAYEMTSTSPSRLTAQAARRLGFGDEVAEYFDEHVEADAVHEQIAAHDLAGALAEQSPELTEDIIFGGAAYLHIEARSQEQILDAWSRGESSLRPDMPGGRAA